MSEDTNWFIDDEHPEMTHWGGVMIFGDDGDMVAEVCGNMGLGIDAIDRARRISATPDLLAACEALIFEQKYFEKHTQQPGYMPGNQFYSDKFMAVVRMAQEAIAKIKVEGNG